MKKCFFLVTICFLLVSCKENHPETFLGIKLGYPADEQFNKAAKEYPLLLTYYGSSYPLKIILSKELNLIGEIHYNVFNNNDGKGELLESITIQFQKENGYLSNSDLSFIKNLYYKKYGNINENNKSDDYINKSQESNYQEINFDNEVRKSYQWNCDNLRIVLNVSQQVTEVSYYYRTNFLVEETNKKSAKQIENNF